MNFKFLKFENKKVMWVLIIGFAIIAGWWLGCYFKPRVMHQIPVDSMTLVMPAKDIGRVVLLDTNNEKFTQDSLKGYWSLMFFGYTDCPDICPMTLATLKDLWNSFKDENIRPDRFYFTSINPEVDQVRKLRHYLRSFSRDFIGLTGSPEEIHKLTQELGILTWTEIEPDQTKKIGHSRMLLLFNPQGRLQGVFSPPFEIQKIKNDLKKVMR